MDRQTEFLKDMLKAFEDLPAEYFAEFRRDAAELEIPVEILCLVVCKEYARERRRRQGKGSI
jgi:hypothetical protein